MTTWVVSTHAGAVTEGRDRRIQLVQLLPGLRFYFFEREGIGLPVPKAWGLYNNIMGALPDYMAIASTPGYEMFDKPALPNYVLTGDDSWVDGNGLLASGIFVFGDTFHRDPRTMYIRAGEQYSLQEFIDWLRPQYRPGDQIYWLACRVWQ